MIEKILILLFILLLVVSCSNNKNTYTEFTTADGLKIITNSNRPNDPNFSVNPELVFSIDFRGVDGLSESGGISRYFAIDNDSNLFISNNSEFEILKYNNKGKLLKTFGGRGYGPGELGSKGKNINGLFISNDSLIVLLQRQMKFNYYNLQNCNFIKSVPVTNKFNYLKNKFKAEGFNLFMESSLTPISDDKYLRFLSYTNQNRKKWGMELAVITSDESGVKENIIFDSIKKKTKDLFSLLFFKHIYKDGKIYLAKNSQDEYEINIYDGFGKKLRVINKHYRKIRYPLMNRVLGLKYAQSIYKLQVDKYGRIWVQSSETMMSKKEAGNIFQIFDQNGIYLNTIELNIDVKCNFICFKKDKMIITGTSIIYHFFHSHFY